MIYLIGGAPRVGKSQLVQKFIESTPIASFSCDFLYDLQQIKDLKSFSSADILEKGRLFYPTLEEILINVSYRVEDCIIEGEVILPEQIAKLSKIYSIRSCFIGLSSTSLETILKYGGSFNWPQWKIEDGHEDEIDSLADRTIRRSAIIEAQAKEYDLPYFDLARDYNTKIQLVLENLQA